MPRYEAHRLEGSTADVDTWTSRDVREIERSHVNYVVADTQQWEQAAAYILDRHDRVEAFVKNAGLGFGIPYLYDGQVHDYLPDFLIRLKDVKNTTIILETKGYDPLADLKASAASRWVQAVMPKGAMGSGAISLRAVYRTLVKFSTLSLRPTAGSAILMGAAPEQQWSLGDRALCVELSCPAGRSISKSETKTQTCPHLMATVPSRTRSS